MTDVLFARGGVSGTDSRTAELRGECPRRTLDVLDAVSLARNYPSRNALVNEILGKWAGEILHQHSVIGRVLGGNPLESEIAGISQNRGCP